MHDLIETTLYPLLAFLKPLHHLHASGMNCLYTYCTYIRDTHLLYKSKRVYVYECFLSNDWWLFLTSCMYPSNYILMGMMFVHTHPHHPQGHLKNCD